MKKDKFKKIIGICQDGGTIKLATFSLSKDILTLLNLDKIEISKKEKENDVSFDNDFLSDLGFGEETKGNDAPVDFSWDEPNNKEEKEDEDNQEMEQIDVTELEKLKSFFEENEVHEGTINLNLDVSNVFYKNIPAPSKKTKKVIIKELYSLFNEENSESAVYSYYFINDDEIVGVKHEKKMILLENILSISQFHPKRKFNFGKIQPNEIALINAVRWNYDIGENEFIAIFYVGLDYSRIILMNGYNPYQVLPIINETTKSPDIINILYSRLLLEKSHHEIPNLNRIFLCGEDITTERLEVLREVEPNSKIERLLPLRIMDDDVRYNPENYTAYIIPTMLAVANAYPKDETLLPVDFLPKKLLEQQNIFSLNVPGFIVLVSILLIGLYGINSFFRITNINRHKKIEIANIKREIDLKKTVVDSIAVMENKISQIKTNMRQVSELAKDKNQWHYILKKMSQTIGKNSVSWITNLHKLSTDNFVIQGQTTIRKNVITFSKMFPNSKIEKLNEKEVEGYTVWNFEIIFGMPDPINTKRLDAKFEKNQKRGILKKSKSTKLKETISLKDEKDIYDKALRYYFNGNFSKAFLGFKEYIKKNNDEKVINAKYFTGECLYQLGKYNQALKIFEEVIEVNKRKIPDSFLMSANCYFKLNDLSDAERMLNQLIKRFPDSSLSEIAKAKLKKMDKYR